MLKGLMNVNISSAFFFFMETINFFFFSFLGEIGIHFH